jgi:hypothetical protein
LRTTGTVIGGPGRAIRSVIKARHHRDADHVDPGIPAGLRPPERAAFSVEPSARFVAVELDPGVVAWLSAVYTMTLSYAGLPVPVFVWLTNVDGVLVAHVDDRRVGTVAPHHARHYAGVLSEAALLDEDPSVPGFLLRVPSRTAPVLRLALPAATET